MAFIFPYIGNVIIPIDESFSEGLKPPTSNHIRSNCIWSEGNGEREREREKKRERESLHRIACQP